MPFPRSRRRATVAAVRPTRTVAVAALVGAVGGIVVAFLLGVGVDEGVCVAPASEGTFSCDRPRPTLRTFLVGGGLGAAVTLSLVGFVLLARSGPDRR